MECNPEKTKQKIQDDEYWFPYHYISKYKPNFTQCYIDSWGINYVATIQFMLEKLSKFHFNSIVDIGCGDGRFTSEVAQIFPNRKVVGIDYSEKAINLAKAMNPSISYINTDIRRDNREDNYDIAILMEVLEHIPLDEVNDFMKRVSDLLSNEGLLFITVPHCNKPVEYKHFQHFSIDSLLNQVQKFFVPCEIIPFEKISIKKQMIDKILLNRFFILNNNFVLNYLYAYYKKNLFIATGESDCKRIFLIAKKR
jgi:2-polyprenyl-3-methyl-5-hydroxy-6-metoxy-1,4-benzoquinol methylase